MYWINCVSHLCLVPHLVGWLFWFARCLSALKERVSHLCLVPYLVVLFCFVIVVFARCLSALKERVSHLVLFCTVFFWFVIVVFARCLSALKDERVSASTHLKGPYDATFKGDKKEFVEHIRQVCVCVYVRVCERERERECVCVCVCVCVWGGVLVVCFLTFCLFLVVWSWCSFDLFCFAGFVTFYFVSPCSLCLSNRKPIY